MRGLGRTGACSWTPAAPGSRTSRRRYDVDQRVTVHLLLEHEEWLAGIVQRQHGRLVLVGRWVDVDPIEHGRPAGAGPALDLHAAPRREGHQREPERVDVDVHEANAREPTDDAAVGPP